MPGRDVLLLLRLVEMGQSQERCRDKQAHTDHLQLDGVVGIKRLDAVLHKKSDNSHRNHRHKDIDNVFLFVVHSAILEGRKQATKDPDHFLPEDDQCGQHRCHMDNDIKREAASLGFGAKQGFTDLEMSA